MLHLYDETATFEYNIDLNDYYNNALSLELMTEQLSKYCPKVTDKTQCEFFVYNTKRDLNNMRNDIEYVKSHKVSIRRKRWVGFLVAFVVQTMVTIVTSALVTYIMEHERNPNIEEDITVEY